MDEHITTEEAAERLRVTPQTIVRYIKDGKLSAVKVGKSYRIRAADVAHLLGLDEAPSRRAVAETIAIVNQSSRAGKTTTALSLAAALGGQGLGRRVLLIDLDPQGGCAAALGIDTEGAETMFGVLVNTVPLARVIIRTDFGFDLAPANVELAGAEFALSRRLVGELLLRRRLEPLLERYDFILLDCPSSLGLLTVSALAAAGSAILPVYGEQPHVRGVEMLLDVIEQVKNAVNSHLHVAGVLVTQYKPMTTSGRDTLAAIADFCRATGTRLFPQVVKQSLRVAESLTFEKPFVQLYPNEDATQAYTEVAQELAAGRSSPIPTAAAGRQAPSTVNGVATRRRLAGGAAARPRLSGGRRSVAPVPGADP